jgi:hypothetical protein
MGPNYVFPSLANNIHIMGSMTKLSCTFDHLSAQLAQVGLRVKVSKYKCYYLSTIFLGIKILDDYILVTNGLHILGVSMGF